MKRILNFLFALLVFGFVQAQEKPEGLFINSKAPEFKAKDQEGNIVNLRELRKKGPVVLVFYRGNWCPYCNRYLRRLQDSLQLITEKGAQLIAVTPELPEGIGKTTEKTGATFPIIHDEGLRIMRAYDVEYAVDEKTVGRYKNGGIDLVATNQKNQANILPVPAVYIIDKEGSIVFRFFEPDYKRRISVKDILQNLK